ncbi:MAG: InlB B-repeat-containing protein [Clostridia bacterium]|nr:InlB B-repeat-containing protein [Clostridia bacterium]
METYSITWDTAGGSLVTGGQTSYTINSTTITLPNRPTKYGYSFVGWRAFAMDGSVIHG